MKRYNIDTTSTTELYDDLIKIGYTDNALNSMTRGEMIEALESNAINWTRPQFAMPPKTDIINYMIDCLGYGVEDVDPSTHTIADLWAMLDNKKKQDCISYNKGGNL